MGIAERIALCVAESDLAWSDDKHKPVEFVAALAATSDLGSDLHRGKDNDAQALRRAILLLAKKAIQAGKQRKRPLSQYQAQAMATAALMEVCMPRCRSCHGAGVSVVENLKVVCGTCGGVAIHRYTDKERARLCGIKRADWPKWESRYLMVLGIAIGHDTAQRDAAERWGR